MGTALCVKLTTSLHSALHAKELCLLASMGSFELRVHVRTVNSVSITNLRCRGLPRQSRTFTACAPQTSGCTFMAHASLVV